MYTETKKHTSNDFDIKEIENRKNNLSQVKDNLKKKFIGIDTIIDKLISNIEVWYLMPELLTRPVIVNLWGLTGVGKTDLVRTLVRELEMSDKFVEVQLDTSTESSWSGSIKYEMDNKELRENDKGIILLDEIQRFRSKDEQGNSINNSKFQDIWMLLSDGKLNTKDTRKKNLYDTLLGLYYIKDDEKEVKKNKKEDKKEKSTVFKMGVWAAKNLKTELGSDESLEEIMKWSFNKKIEMVEQKLRTLDSEEHIDQCYNKLLIFISGNIDNAYSMSENVSQTSIDADILHEFSKDISVIQIKAALSSFFKPEQISRFGNTHIIYPSISKKSYQELIKRKLSDITDKTKEAFNIDLIFDLSVREALYRNGVYPSQGVRPLFSSISSIIENSVPSFLLIAFLSPDILREITFSVDIDKSVLIGKIGEEYHSRKIDLDLDSIKNNLNEDSFYKTCVHEVGHAVAYSLLFKQIPTQIVGDSLDIDNNGFVIPHRIASNKTLLEYHVQVLLAGTVAEEMIYSLNHKANGAAGDLINATNIITNMIRSWNMYDNVSKIVHKTSAGSDSLNNNIDPTNELIETILTTQKENVRKLLEDNRVFYREILRALIDKKRLLANDFKEISDKYHPDLQISESNHLIISEYKNITEEFLNEK